MGGGRCMERREETRCGLRSAEGARAGTCTHSQGRSSALSCTPKKMPSSEFPPTLYAQPCHRLPLELLSRPPQPLPPVEPPKAYGIEQGQRASER